MRRDELAGDGVSPATISDENHPGAADRTRYDVASVDSAGRSPSKDPSVCVMTARLSSARTDEGYEPRGSSETGWYRDTDEDALRSSPRR